MHKYGYLRNKLSRSGRSGSSNKLLTLFFWLGSTSSATPADIVNRIADAVGWEEARLFETLGVKYMGISDRDLLQLLDFESILELQTIMADIDPLEHARLASSEKLIQNQRTALVVYLLEQDYVREEMQIWNVDGLFVYFLIDVQMGPQLHTWRIKQAFSTMQLFAQRCLLGMEKGVSKESLGRDRWGWMQQYRLWEANRNLFLYPKNWIDPTLRDNKSQFFGQFEANLMQKDLSIDTFLQAAKLCVNGLSEISSPDIVAYQHLCKRMQP
ncbi:hypothetical protein LY78DRAFT_674108 [Colletotrichum sublineola]|nr:hypothetical protein LY78DRAFT_674108 [Colletotrichum sublineola]